MQPCCNVICSRNTVKFWDSERETTVEADHMLNKAKLKTELSLIYENDEFKACSDALTLFQFFMENNPQGMFTKTDSHHRIHDNSTLREVHLNFKEDQLFPDEHHDKGSPGCSAFVIYEEKTHQKHSWPQ